MGVAGGVILAGPPLFGLYQAGTMSGTGALTRGLIVVAVCTIAATILDTILQDFENDAVTRERGEIVASRQGPQGQPGQDGAENPGQPPPS